MWTCSILISLRNNFYYSICFFSKFEMSFTINLFSRFTSVVFTVSKILYKFLFYMHLFLLDSNAPFYNNLLICYHFQCVRLQLMKYSLERPSNYLTVSTFCHVFTKVNSEFSSSVICPARSIQFHVFSNCKKFRFFNYNI